jgi:hypothetical protein
LFCDVEGGTFQFLAHRNPVNRTFVICSFGPHSGGDAEFWRDTGKMFATAALVLAASLLGAMPAQQAADLSVDLDAQGLLLLPGARYDVSITNHGPDALESATVVVTLEHPVMQSTPTACVLDTAARTLTCSFGSLPAGGTVTASGYVYYLINGAPKSVKATATRTASTPSDPDPSNDTDTKTCWFEGPSGIPPSIHPPLRCGLFGGQ